MSDSFGSIIDQCCGVLKLDFSSTELAQLAVEKGFSQDTLSAVSALFEYLRDKKEQTTIQTILRMSRLPQKVPKTVKFAPSLPSARTFPATITLYFCHRHEASCHLDWNVA
jgi:hypothetical protein